MQQTYYIASGLEWPSGQVVCNATFADAPHKSFFVPDVPSEYANNPDYLARRATEHRLEVIRAARFPTLPSREHAIFLNEDVEAARKWVSRGARKDYCIYELIPKRTDNKTIVNYIWYNYSIRLHKNPDQENRNLFSSDPNSEIEQSLQAYWSNRSTEEFQCATESEVLFVGELTVFRKVA